MRISDWSSDVCCSDLAYREDWLRQAVDAARTADPDQAFRALHQATSLTRIDVYGELALAHKKFDGALPMRDGSAAPLHWRTQYFCRRAGGAWRIAGIVGYMEDEIGRASWWERVCE